MLVADRASRRCLQGMPIRLIDGFSGVALEAIHLDAGKKMTTLAKLSRRVDPQELAVVVARGMAIDASGKAIALGANPLLHGIVTLVQQKFHMVAAHYLGRLDTLLAFRLRER